MTDRIIIPRVVSQLGHTSEAFFTTDHQLIYAAILSCYDRHGQVDPLLTAKELEKADHLKRAGGAVFLYDLQARIVETENTEFYAEIIRENWLRRRLIQTSNHLHVLAMELIHHQPLLLQSLKLHDGGYVILGLQCSSVTAKPACI